MRKAIALLLVGLLAGCTSSPPVRQQVSRPVTRLPTNPPPQVPPAAERPGAAFIAPQIMRLPGLEGVIGASPAELQRLFGTARLDLLEGDARKLQFSGEACVLDIYLYPLRPGALPSATHVEARRASDGQAVDRAACVRALSGKQAR